MHACRKDTIDLLRQYTPQYLELYGGQAAPQVHSVLGKLALCRTAALGGHVYKCPQCEHRCEVYNSCIDRHCPLCSGGRRVDWLAKTAELLLPKIDYFQVVFTLPEQLWPLMLGNRRATYRLLFHAAWEALRGVLRGSRPFCAGALEGCEAESVRDADREGAAKLAGLGNKKRRSLFIGSSEIGRSGSPCGLVRCVERGVGAACADRPLRWAAHCGGVQRIEVFLQAARPQMVGDCSLEHGGV